MHAVSGGACASCRAICLFIAIGLLLGGKGKAQEKTDILHDLAQKLQSPDRVTRRTAVEALGVFGAAAMPALIGALKDQDAEVRVSAAEALVNIGPAAKEAVPALIVALKDPEGMLRFYAAWALGQIGPEAKEAVPALIAALKDPNEFVYDVAQNALKRIGTAAVPALIIALKYPEVGDRSSAAEALGKVGPAAKEVVPALIEGTQGSRAACSQLRSQGTGGDRA